MNKDNSNSIHVAIFHTKATAEDSFPAQIIFLVPDNNPAIAILLLSSLVSNINDWELSALIEKTEFETIVKKKMLTDSSFLSPN